MQENQQNVTDNSQLREEVARDENRPSNTQWENVNPSGQGTTGLTCSSHSKHTMLWAKGEATRKDCPVFGLKLPVHVGPTEYQS